jgi:hypothetical protein
MMANSDRHADEQEHSALTYFQQLHDASVGAVAASGAVARTIRIAGHPIRLVFAGQAMVSQVMRALRHLESQDEEPDLTVYVWDTATTGQTIPSPPWDPDDHLPRGFIRGFNLDGIYTANLPAMDGFSMYHSICKTAVHWNPDATAITFHERSFPLRVIFSWWGALHELQFAHAGAVGSTDNGVIIVGKGGSGKSTTALACLNSGLLYASDDHVLLATGAEPCVHSLYNSAKLHAHHIRRFPELKPHISNADRLDREKALLYLYEAFPEQISAGFRIKAILVPEVSVEAETRLVPISGAAALTALAPSSILLLPGKDGQAFRRLSQLVRQVPAYKLQLGTRVARIPVVIKKLLTTL